MPGKTRLSSYCIVRDDERLHSLILFKMKEKGHDIQSLADYLGVHNSNVRKFIKNREKAISQQKTIAICILLGISIGLNVNIVE